MVSLLRLLTSFWAVLLSGYVLADTEIINFAVSPFSDVVIPQASEWLVLNSEVPQRNFEVPPAPLGTPLTEIHDYMSLGPYRHELWVVLDLDDTRWVSFSKFTLRVSWPANYPTHFDLKTFTPAQTYHTLTQGLGGPTFRPIEEETSTRRQYARIRLVDIGVPTPPAANTTAQAVPFTILVEPLYFGVLPKSVIPIIAFLTPVVLVAAFIVAPIVNKKLAGVATQVKAETVDRKERIS